MSLEVLGVFKSLQEIIQVGELTFFVWSKDTEVSSSSASNTCICNLTKSSLKFESWNVKIVNVGCNIRCGGQNWENRADGS